MMVPESCGGICHGRNSGPGILHLSFWIKMLDIQHIQQIVRVFEEVLLSISSESSQMYFTRHVGEKEINSTAERESGSIL